MKGKNFAAEVFMKQGNFYTRCYLSNIWNIMELWIVFWSMSKKSFAVKVHILFTYYSIH